MSVIQAIQDLHAKIAGETDANALVELYKQLVPLLKEPRPRISDLSPAEKSAHRDELKAARAAGINLRTGKPWTDEQRAKQSAYWTPERRAEFSAKSKGRTVSPEAKANIQAAAVARKNRQAAMEARLKELEAIVAGKATAPEGESNEQQHRGGRRGR